MPHPSAGAGVRTPRGAIGSGAVNAEDTTAHGEVDSDRVSPLPSPYDHLPPRLRARRRQPSRVREELEQELTLGDEWLDPRERRKLADMSRHCQNWVVSSGAPRERVYSDDDLLGLQISGTGTGGDTDSDRSYTAALGDNRAAAPRPMANAASDSSHHIIRVGLTEDRPHTVIVMVGLPARGKSFIAKRLKRYLSWSSHKTRTFNAGNQRRKMLEGKVEMESDFFDADNKEAAALRERMANMALDSAFEWFRKEDGRFAIFDATNTTRARRKSIVKRCREEGVSVAFLESICDSKEVLEANINQKLATSADYRAQDFKTAKGDLLARIAEYEKVYETVSDDRLSYIKMFNLSSKLLVNRIFGRMAKEVVPFIMALHVGRRPIWLTRSGSCRKYRHRHPRHTTTGMGVAEELRGEASNDADADVADDGDADLRRLRRRRTAPPHSESDVSADSSRRDDTQPLPFVTPFYQSNASLDARGKRYAKALGALIKQRLRDFAEPDGSFESASSSPQIAASPVSGGSSPGVQSTSASVKQTTTRPPSDTIGDSSRHHRSKEPELCIFSGTLRRSTQTTEDVLQTCSVSSSSRQDTALNLMNKGLCTGLSMSQVKEFYPKLYDDWVKDPFTNRFPGGESFSDLLQRLQSMVISIEQQTLPVLVVSHTSSLQLLYSYFLHDDQKKENGVAACFDVDIPRHTVIELCPDSSGHWVERRFNLWEDDEAEHSNLQEDDDELGIEFSDGDLGEQISHISIDSHESDSGCEGDGDASDGERP